MKLLGYLRVSTEGQVGEDKFGLEVQRSSIEEYCAKNGHEVVRWFVEEGVSGAKEDRPQFNILRSLTAEELDGIGGIIVAKSDRIARDVYLYFAFKNEFRQKGLQIISVAEDFGDMGQYGVILDCMIAAIAQVERDNITRRTQSGRKKKAEKGGFTGGAVPYGYKLVNKELEVNEEEADVVRNIFALRDEGVSYQRIAEALNESGIKTHRGCAFTPMTVYLIVKNEYKYLGYYRFGDMDWVHGRHEAIL